jgi:GNAT superfamily N-acetyltransferase
MKEDTTRIRKFDRADLHALHRMICETIEASYPGLYPPRAVAFFREYHSERRIAERSEIGEILVLISEPIDSILATGSLIGSEIMGVFVRSDHQRHGYGKDIMTQLELMAIEKGLPQLNLSISLPSRLFYEHLGYRVLDECVIDVGGGEFLKYWSGKKELHLHDRRDVNVAMDLGLT